MVGGKESALRGGPRRGFRFHDRAFDSRWEQGAVVSMEAQCIVAAQAGDRNPPAPNIQLSSVW